MTSQCHLCRHYSGGITNVRVDGRTADEWEEWACELEGRFIESDYDSMDKGQCRFFERCTPEEIKQ